VTRFIISDMRSCGFKMKDNFFVLVLYKKMLCICVKWATSVSNTSTPYMVLKTKRKKNKQRDPYKFSSTTSGCKQTFLRKKKIKCLLYEKIIQTITSSMEYGLYIYFKYFHQNIIPWWLRPTIYCMHVSFN